MSNAQLLPYQLDAIEKLDSGSILSAGVGTGKSITALGFFFLKELSKRPDNKALYIITTARKRDTKEWDAECERWPVQQSGVSIHIDSWNNVHKFEDVTDSFFIFDEQRVVGSGKWVRSFLKISKSNRWILLSATPGDTWLDYAPVFIANGFYKNRTDFLRQHVVYSYYCTKYPKIEKYVNVTKLETLRRRITVVMSAKKITVPHFESITVPYDEDKYRTVLKNRWDPYSNEPIQDMAKVCYLLRRVVNSSAERLSTVKELYRVHRRLIVFYNFDYELEALLTLNLGCQVAQWNGHRHEPIPKSDSWLYLVQYTAGAEGWNCVLTDTIVFYSQNYSYKTMIQAAGRIDRMNTPYRDLYYYTLKSRSSIDTAITNALRSKKKFNENQFLADEKIT